MIRKLTLAATTALALTGAGAMAAEVETEIEDFAFSFEGPFGSFDQNQLQRGLKIYTEVCAACHGLELLAFRNLSDETGPALPEDQMRAYAEFYEVWDPLLFDGEGDFRPATPADKFPSSSLANAPDLTLMAKARAGFHGPYGLGLNQFFKGMGGPEYIVALLDGYTGKEVEQAGSIFYENNIFGNISMAPPLSDGMVEFSDGHANDAHHMAVDVAAFLMWAAEPKLMVRKQVGFMGVFFLGVLAILLYLTNKKLWAPHKGRKEV